MVVEQAKRFHRVEVVAARPPGGLLQAGLCPGQVHLRTARQVKRFEQAVADVTGQRVAVEFIVLEESAAEAAPAKRVVPPYQRLMEAAKNPLVRRAGELFGAQPLRVEDKDEFGSRKAEVGRGNERTIAVRFRIPTFRIPNSFRFAIRVASCSKDFPTSAPC